MNEFFALLKQPFVKSSRLWDTHVVLDPLIDGQPEPVPVRGLVEEVQQSFQSGRAHRSQVPLLLPVQARVELNKQVVECSLPPSPTLTLLSQFWSLQFFFFVLRKILQRFCCLFREQEGPSTSSAKEPPTRNRKEAPGGRCKRVGSTWVRVHGVHVHRVQFGGLRLWW